MYSVRVDKDGEGYLFRVQPTEGVFEMVSLDSSPSLIAFVHAASPGEATSRAWKLGTQMHGKARDQLESLGLLLEKKK